LFSFLRQVRAVQRLHYIPTLVLLVAEAVLYELFALDRNEGLGREDHLRALENDLLLYYLVLRNSVAERPLAEDHLVEDHADTSDVHLGANLRRTLSADKSLGRQVPIGADALRGQLQL